MLRIWQIQGQIIRHSMLGGSGRISTCCLLQLDAGCGRSCRTRKSLASLVVIEDMQASKLSSIHDESQDISHESDEMTKCST